VEAAEAAARATLPTPEEERAIIDAAEALAGGDAGVPAKSRAAVLRLETKSEVVRLPGEAWRVTKIARTRTRDSSERYILYRV